MLSYSETPIQAIQTKLLEDLGIAVLVKREDLNHPVVGGNKWWKLKYNLEDALKTGVVTLLTFGGAFSNHICATARAAKECGMKSIGIIRGEEPKVPNPVLTMARSDGMALHFISREDYRRKNDPDFVAQLKKQFGEFFLIPEGGTNRDAIRGCVEWASQLGEIPFDYLCLPVGTGGTLAGMIIGLPERKVIGYAVLKDADFLRDEITAMTRDYAGREFRHWQLETGYSFGGYAKTTAELRQFVRTSDVALDEVYTGKMMFGVMDQIRNGRFERGSTILVVHTGGRQATGRLKSS